MAYTETKSDRDRRLTALVDIDSDQYIYDTVKASLVDGWKPWQIKAILRDGCIPASRVEKLGITL